MKIPTQIALTWALALAALWPVAAHAELAGAVDGRALIGLDGRDGGALSVDLWGTRSVLRPGASFGIGALSKNRHASSRVFTPLALSLGLFPSGEASGFMAVARAGGYAGAEKGGFIGGAFFSGMLGYELSLGEGANIHLAAEAVGLVGQHGGIFLGPTLGLGF